MNEQTKGLTKVTWKADGLVPVIVQDVESREVLMLAYMNEEALDITLHEGQACYYSRSRQCLWRKGETSGHRQEVLDLRFDCDQDAILLTVRQTGMACHENYFSCFHYRLGETGFWAFGEPEVRPEVTPELKSEVMSELTLGVTPGLSPEVASEVRSDAISEVKQGVAREVSLGNVLEELAEIIHTRNVERPEGAYTTYLFEKGLDKILKKVGEECAEVIIAAKNPAKDEIRYEASDLLYHLLVLLEEQGVGLAEISTELQGRRK